MLSIETPPGPSCPCTSSALRTDERASDRLAFDEAEPVGLGETQTPNFSIRNYVFKSRSKDIATNWPFPHQFLQLCLKQGVRDQLPPFEPPDSVRGWCCRKAAEPEQPVSCAGAENISARFESLEIKDVGPVGEEPCNIKSKSCLRSDELVVGCSDQVEYPLSEKRKQAVDRGDISDDEPSETNAETVSAVTNHDQIERASNKISELHCSVQVTRSVSEASSDVETAELHPVPSKLEIVHGASEKKCRLIVKLGAITETSSTEDIVSTSSTVSDSMASKLCPVCKIFASTSNTTLNAHIDQCLSADSYNIKRVVTKTPKPKVKPSKKRLMVDIYVTAPHCTLEDLDRRNGTNWASELTNLMAPTSEACTEIKRAKLSPVDTRNDEKTVDTRDDENEGAVYVDSNGIKLRILSKSNETPPVMSREHFKLKQHAKKIKEGKNLLNSKKKLFASKFSKYTRVKPQTKKPSSFKPFKGEIQGAPGGYHDAGTDHLEKEESPSEISNAPDQIKSSGSATLRHWVCSKRSDLPKKLNHKDINNSENSVLITRNLLAESNQPDIGNSSVVKSHIFKFSRPTEDLTYSPKTKRVDFLSKNDQIMDIGRNPKSPVFNSKWSSKSTSTNGLMLKISRPSGTPISSPRSRREEIHISTTQKSDNFRDTTMRSPESCHPSLKAKKSLSMKKNVLFGRPSSLEGSKGDTGNKLSISKKFRKHRSILWTGKLGESPSDVNGRLCRPIKHIGLDAARTNKTTRTHRSDISESISRFTTGEIMDQESPSSSNISESEGEDASTMERQKYNSLKWHPEVQCYDPELATSDMQVEALALVDVMTKPSMEKTVGNTVGSVPVISENLAPVSKAKLNPGPSVDENVQFVCEGEAHVEPPTENLCDEQAVQYCNVNRDEIVSQSIPVADEVVFRGKGDPCAAQYRECQAVTVPVQEFSACLTSPGDATLEIPQENSSITSIRITSGQDQNLAIDREPSESPVSTVSTISPSPKDTEFKYSVAEPLMRPTVHYNSGLAFPCDTSIYGTEGRNVERRIQEVKPFPLAKEPEKFSHDQPCCCLQRGGFSRDSQFMRQNAMDRTMLPSSGEQISNLYITASISSPFSSYPSLGTYAMATPILESPTESITTRASADFDVKAPTCFDFSSPSPSPRTQTQSTSNSVLRLMGKNLMVANKEESAQLPVVYPAPDNPSSTQCLPPVFASTGWECFSYHPHQLPDGSAVFGQAPSVVGHQIPLHSSNMRVDGFAGSLQAGLKTKLDQQIHHTLNKKPNSLSACNMERTATSHQHLGKPLSSSQANMMKEVIVIDDSPEFEAELKCSVLNPAGVLPAIPDSYPMQQRPFSCFPSQTQFFSKDVTSGFKPYPNVCPRDYASTMKRGKTSEGSDPLLSRPFVFQSPPTGHLSPSFYYSETLR